MRVWTQQELDEAMRSEMVEIHLGTGDFRGVTFRAKSGMIIGDRSILGANTHVGVACRIGDNCDIGDGFRADGTLHIGEHCHFGADAILGELARIGRETCFASGVVIGAGTQLGDGVGLPHRCELFGVPDADGRTLLKIAQADGSVIHAFAAGRRERQVWVCMKQMRRTLEEFEDFAADWAGSTDGMTNVREGRRMLAAAKYIRARFALDGHCAPYREENRYKKSERQLRARLALGGS